jgi:predicted porin
MKKQLVVAAIAAALSMPAANADVVVYGKVHVSIDSLNYDFGSYEPWEPIMGGTIGVSYGAMGTGWYVASRASRIGFKGTEDLGNGLSLIWKAETTYDFADGNAWDSGRNAYIGLAGDWGTFLYGIHDTPFKMSTGQLDLFADQLGDYNNDLNAQHALLGPGFDDVRAPNAIAYISPNMNGLTFAAAIVPGENSVPGSDGLADGYSLAAMYSNNGLYLSAAYEDVEDLDLHIHQKWRIGVGYTINTFTLNAIYENDHSGWSGGPTDDDHDIWQVSGAYDFGNNRIKAAYGENSGEHTYEFGATESKRKSWAIGLDHKLSKRTTAYAVYADVSNSSSGRGMVMLSSPEPDVDGFSMGLIHNF